MKFAVTGIAITLVLAVEAVVAVPPHASAALKDLGIQVIDLKPGDGAPASYAWATDRPLTEVFARSAPGLLDEHWYMPGWMTPMSAAAATPSSRARAWVDGTSLRAEASFPTLPSAPGGGSKRSRAAWIDRDCFSWDKAGGGSRSRGQGNVPEGRFWARHLQGGVRSDG